MCFCRKSEDSFIIDREIISHDMRYVEFPCRLNALVALIFPIVLTWWSITPVRAIGFSRISVSPFRFLTLIKISIAPVSNSIFIWSFFISLIGSITSLRSIFTYLSVICVIWCSLTAPPFLLFFFAASIRGFFALALSLISSYFCSVYTFLTKSALRIVVSAPCRAVRSAISTRFFYVLLSYNMCKNSWWHLYLLIYRLGAIRIC